MSTTTIEIIKPDRYLDHTNRAVNCKAGDHLKTRVGYGKTLVNAQLAKPVPAKVASEPATAEGGPAEPVDVLAGLSIPAVLEAIKAGDVTPEEALEIELGKGADARKSLVEKLESIIGFDDEAEPVAIEPATAEGGDDEASD